MDAIARTLSRIKFRTEGTPFHVILLVGKGTQGHCHPLTVFPYLRQRPSANGYAGGFCCMKKSTLPHVLSYLYVSTPGGDAKHP